MNPLPRVVGDPLVPIPAVHLLLTETPDKPPAPDPERAIEKIRLQATQLGPVLEGILREPHTEPRWE